MKSITDIKRYPLRKKELLQGWDSADELLLSYVSQLDLRGKRILIINDQFGALSCGLAEYDCLTYSDSFVSTKGILLNSEQTIHPVNDLDEFEGLYDYVLIQIPKNMSFFEDILCHLTGHLRPGSKVICAAMIKHLAPTSFDLLNKLIGKTTTSLAQKKARLIFADFEMKEVPSPYPVSVKIDSFAKPFINHSNLFSRDKLDVGSRFFLDHLPTGQYTNILDLGCANGLIGIKAKLLNPGATMSFSDESAMAIKSARTNYKRFFQDEADFYWTNCFEAQRKNYLDLVLCNPPFHQGNTVGDFIAHQMFQDAHESLRPGGVLRIIGNSHLGHQVKLKKIFGNYELIAKNNKFTIFDARKQPIR